MKNQKGSSAVIWILGVILLIIVILLTFQFLKGAVEKEKQKSIKTEMLQVQAKAKIVLEQYHVDNNQPLKGEKIEDKALEEKYGIDDISQYYKWTQENLKEVGLKEINLKEGEYYLINYETEEVIYSAGYLDEEGNLRYKLSEIKEAQ